MTYSISPVRTVAPSETPVSRTEAKAHLRVTGTTEDTLIDGLIAAAVAHVDGWSGILGRCVVTQTWRQDVDDFSDCVALPFPDVQSVTVTYYDAANAVQTLSGSTYNLVNRTSGTFLELADGASWPVVYSRPDAVKISMVCGYGAAAAVPVAIKQAMLVLIGHWYSNREAVSEAAMSEVPLAVGALLAPYRRIGL